MRNHDDLAVLAQLMEQLPESTHVGVVKHCIDLIQDTERRRGDSHQRKYESRGGQAAFST